MAEEKKDTSIQATQPAVIVSQGRGSIWNWLIGGLVLVGAGAGIAWYFTKGSSVSVSDYQLSVQILTPVVPRSGTVQIQVIITNNSESAQSPVLRFDMWPTGHTPVEGSPQSAGSIDPGETVTVIMSYVLPSDWGGGTELNAQLMLIGVEGPVWDVVSGVTVQGDTGIIEVVSVTPVNETLIAADTQPAKVTVVVSNSTPSSINRTFRLDLKGHNKATWYEGGTRTVNLAPGTNTGFVLSCDVPTDWGASNSPVAVKIMDIGESRIFYGDLDGSISYQLFTIVPISQLKAYSSESFIISQVPADRLVSNGQAISFTLGVKHIGGPKSYKAGCYIKTESPYWITQDFDCALDENWTTYHVTVSGIFHSSLGSGRWIDELMAFLNANIGTPSVPARDQELLFANWDTALRVR